MVSDEYRAASLTAGLISAGWVWLTIHEAAPGHQALLVVVGVFIATLMGLDRLAPFLDGWDTEQR